MTENSHAWPYGYFNLTQISMVTQDTNADYFIWFNAHTQLYELGDAQQFEIVKKSETQEITVSLILKFNSKTHGVAKKILYELNAAKEKVVAD